MKKPCILLFSLIAGYLCTAQLSYLADIRVKGEHRYPDSSINIPIDYWRFDTCLYLPGRICRYNTATAANIKIATRPGEIRYQFTHSNNSGYKSEHLNDSMTWYFHPLRPDSTLLIRKIWIDRLSDVKAGIYRFKTDTFRLHPIDTLTIRKKRLVRSVFGKNAAKTLAPLPIYVFQSTDVNGSKMYHFWAGQIGIIKLTDEKCWRYSFEMRDDRSRAIEKLFSGMMKLIREKYPDPHWTGEACYFE